MRSLLSNWRDYLVYLALRIFVCVVQATPVETCETVAHWVVVLACDILRIRQSVIDENLRHAFPQLSPRERYQLTRQMWEHLVLFLLEIVHAPRRIHQTNWRDYITLRDADQIIRAFFLDRPSVVICGHYGNFELSGYALGILGFPTYTIARRLDNVYLDRFLNAFRGLTGQYILNKTGSSAQIDAVLARGGILALLGDQYAGPKGCWVDFFGRPASSHKAIALLSLTSEAPAVFCYARRTGQILHHEMGTTGVLDPLQTPAEMRTVGAITQWYTEQLEYTIRQAPEQYWWLHRRWKDPRSKTPLAAPNKAA
ncbi:MAG TPA: lysophospholipid acyltransferase family protein [Pirellulales bacterium]|nr:lysophospholipid acyltransferase family protein [Pirellulales bacterium]